MIKSLFSWFNFSEEEGLKSYFLKAGSGSTLILAVSLVIAFITSILLARYLGPHDYGVYAFIISLIIVFSNLSLLGFDSLISRETAILRAPEKQEQSKTLFKYGLRKFLPMLLLVWLIAIFFSNWFPILRSLSFQDRFIAFSAIPFISMMLYFASRLHGNQHILSSLISKQIVRAISFLTLIILIKSFYKDLSLTVVLMLSTSTYVLALIVATYLLKRKEPGMITYQPKSEIQHTNNKLWNGMAMQFFLLATVEWLSKKIDILLVGNILTSYDLGIYHIALKMAELMLIPTVAINIVAAPKIAGYYAKNDLKRLKNFTVKVTRAIIIFSLLVFILLIFFGPLILKVYGQEYEGAYLPMIILAAAIFFQLFYGFAGLVLLMTRNVNPVIRGTAVALLVYTIAYSVFIPKMGIVGAAIAYGIGLITLKAIMYFEVVQRFGFHLNPFARIDK